MKDIRISVRVSQEIKERLENAEKATGIDEATLVRQCVLALLDEIESKGQITFPLEISPKRKRDPDPIYTRADQGESIRVEEKTADRTKKSKKL